VPVSISRAWNENPQKIKVKNQDKIDWLWCQSIFLPNMSNLSEIVKGIELGDFLLTVGGLMPICKHCASTIKRPIRPLPSLNG
jgi:hypothetical protein